ncbi:MAG: succinate dehydrogenase cytochrome b subunit [Candidatus Methylomirabilis oxyfera]|nr:succinate dehydrogenase cytochrome b subunit [Candidatus Methylomirabilis oxyfera]
MNASAVMMLWGTSIGKKAVMAVTGFILVGFVIGHMLGNLKIYQGEEKFNAYAAWLREVGSPAFGHEQFLWLARLILLMATALHIVAAAQLTQMSYDARPVSYAQKKAIQATYASRTMRWGGVIITLFVVYHILHFTFGAVGFTPGQYKHLSVYRNVVIGFSVWYVAAFYIAAMVALGLHMYHGVWSMFQTLGLNTENAGRPYQALATVSSIVVVLGNISVPTAVLAGLLK